MGVSGLVVSGEVGLNKPRHQGVVYGHAAFAFPLGGGACHHKLQHIEQPPAIAATGAQQSLPFDHLDLVALQPFILCEGAVDERLQLVPAKGLQNIHLAAGKQGWNDLEAGVLGGGTYERHRPALHRTEQAVLL